MKIKILTLLFTLICSIEIAVADESDFKTSISNIADKYPGMKTLVLFKSQTPLMTSDEIKQAVTSNATDVLINSGCIKNILNTYTDKKTGCGVIVGQWSTEAFAHSSEFQNVIFNKTRNLKNTVSFVYLNKDGDTEHPDKYTYDLNDAWYDACIR